MTGTQQSLILLSTALPLWLWILSTAVRRLSRRVRELKSDSETTKRDARLLLAAIRKLEKDMYGDDSQKQ